METNDGFRHDRRDRIDSRSGRVWGGMVLVVIGLLFLARQAGADIPHWMFSWEMILIGVGIFVGARRAFQPGGWMILLLVGGVFLANDLIYDFELRHFLWPAVIIGIGLYMIIKPRRRLNSSDPDTISSESSIDSMSILGGTKRNIIAKDFKGGDITTFFGGADLNLTQADIVGSATLHLSVAFGGIKLVVPPHWNIKSEVVCILGGIDDKRPISKDTPDSNKLLILKGTCVFGGIDIKSY